MEFFFFYISWMTFCNGSKKFDPKHFGPKQKEIEPKLRKEIRPKFFFEFPFWFGLKWFGSNFLAPFWFNLVKTCICISRVSEKFTVCQCAFRPLLLMLWKPLRLRELCRFPANRKLQCNYMSFCWPDDFVTWQPSLAYK